jgi:hypothetical protein
MISAGSLAEVVRSRQSNMKVRSHIVVCPGDYPARPGSLRK